MQKRAWQKGFQRSFRVVTKLEEERCWGWGVQLQLGSKQIERAIQIHKFKPKHKYKWKHKFKYKHKINNEYRYEYKVRDGVRCSSASGRIERTIEVAHADWTLPLRKELRRTTLSLEFWHSAGHTLCVAEVPMDFINPPVILLNSNNLKRLYDKNQNNKF